MAALDGKDLGQRLIRRALCHPLTPDSDWAPGSAKAPMLRLQFAGLERGMLTLQPTAINARRAEKCLHSATLEPLPSLCPMARDPQTSTAVKEWATDLGHWGVICCLFRLSRPPAVLSAAMLALPLAGCLTAWTKEAPSGVYPGGPLSGPPTYFVGWTQTFTSPTERLGKDFQSPLVRPGDVSSRPPLSD
jgi:hypothetical protein